MNRTLAPGSYIKGPEPNGCFNTGVAPVIAHSKRAEKYLGKAYIVGRDMDILFDLPGLVQSVLRGGKSKVKFFKTSKSAWAEFDRLTAQMDAANAEEHQVVAKLKARADHGDLEALLELHDYR